MKPTDEKTRENIVLAKQRNEKRQTIALWLNVSISTVDKVWRRYRETGSYLAIPYTGRKSDITAEQDDLVRAKIKETPDITLERINEELKLGLTVSGLWRRMDKMGLSYKKRHSTPTDKNDPML